MRLRLVAVYLVAHTIYAQPVFEQQVLDNNVAIGYGLAVGDVDGDKKADILLADKKQFVWYRNGDWRRFVLIENLTEADNVCIAARDIDGDGKVEIAVGAQWNPGETSDTLKSGSVHYLIRPGDPTSQWKAMELHHEPTIHRMKWMKVGPNEFRLIVVPLHGRGNKNGAGEGVRVLAYKPSGKPGTNWMYEVVDESMHLTHNFEIIPDGNKEKIAIAGKEGLKVFDYADKKWALSDWKVKDYSIGEVRRGSYRLTDGKTGYYFASVEPMHGTKVTVHLNDNRRLILDSTYNQGHALACADLSGTGSDQVIAGWREPDKNGKTGIKIFIPQDNSLNSWKPSWLDDNGIACEDLVVADLNGDNKPDIIAAGRASRNLKIYWNRRK